MRPRTAKSYLSLTMRACAIALSASLLTACADGGTSGDTGNNNTSTTETSSSQSTASDSATQTSSIPEYPQIIDTDQVKPYRPTSPYADVLRTCALVDYRTPCKLSTLPYIGYNNENPTVEDILNRTVVTHDWMGVRLSELLTALPADMLKLFRPVTTVVIGSNVRPSSFSSSRGRMQIDAQHLWLSLEEKTTVSTEEDYRSNFGADLKFVSYWRLVRGEEYAVPFFSLRDSSERKLEDILIQAARPLYHELAHANDDLRPEDINAVSLELTPAEAVDQFEDNGVAYRLYQDASITVQNSDLYSLARVRYRDNEPTEFEKTVLADYVGSLFANEGKVSFYGYYTIYEDVATLFARTMLKYHFDVETQLGVMNKPENHPDAECKEYKVAWGSRNRLAAPLVAARAKWVVEQIIEPSAQLDAFFANSADGNTVGDDTPLRVGDNWCDARYINPVEIAESTQQQRSRNTDVISIERELFRDH